jgi:hypothetical protein
LMQVMLSRLQVKSPPSFAMIRRRVFLQEDIICPFKFSS